METPFGRELQALRRARGLSIRQVADEAGIHVTTLRRWEKGEHQPRMTELRVVLNKLAAPEETKTQLFAWIDAPRAAKERPTISFVFDGSETHAPCVGDLWRMLRSRRGLTPEQAARHAGKNVSTLCRIEASQLAPSRELQQELFAVYRASDAERAALANRWQISLPSALERPQTWPQWNAWLSEQLDARLSQDKNALDDLDFLGLEAFFWRDAPHNAEALRHLAYTYTYHADYLLWKGRLTEMEVFARRALDFSELGQLPPENYRLKAAYIRAMRYEQTNPRRAMRLLKDQEETAMELGNTSTLYRDMANYAGAMGHPERALSLLTQSRQSADPDIHPEEFRLADIIEARTRLRMQQPEKALRLLEAIKGVGPGPQTTIALHMAEALAACGEPSEAGRWLDRFYVLIEQNRFEHLRVKGDKIAPFCRQE